MNRALLALAAACLAAPLSAQPDASFRTLDPDRDGWLSEAEASEDRALDVGAFTSPTATAMAFSTATSTTPQWP